MVQTKPHSQPHAIKIKDLQMFALSQALLDVLCQNWQPKQEPILLSLPILQLGGTHPTSSWWTQAHLVPCQGCHLLQEGFGLSSSPRLRRRGASAGHDPAQSKMAVDRSVANTGDMVRAQLLIA